MNMFLYPKKVLLCLVAAMLVTFAFFVINENFYDVREKPDRVTITVESSGKHIAFRGAQVDGNWYNPSELAASSAGWLYDEEQGKYTAVGKQPLIINLPVGTQRALTFDAGPKEGIVTVRIADEELTFDLWDVNEIELGLPYDLPDNHLSEYRRYFYSCLMFFITFTAFLFMYSTRSKKQSANTVMEQEPRSCRDKRRRSVYAVAVVFLQCMILAGWAHQKEVYFIDELYTYKSIANLYQEDVPTVNWYSGTIPDNTYVSFDDFMDYLTVGEGDSILEQPFSMILKSIVTDNTFHVLMNLLFTFSQGRFLKWIPTLINILAFCMIQYLFYKIVMRLYDDYQIAVLLMGVYGVTFAAVETVLYIRHYAFYVLFTMLYALWLLKLTEKNSVRIREVLLSMVFVWFGFQSCEYMLVYAGLLSVGFLGFCIYKKQWGKGKIFTGCYLFGAAVFVIYNYKMVKSSLQGQAAGDQVYTAVSKMTDGNFERIWRETEKYMELLWEYAGGHVVFLISLTVLAAALIKYGKAVYVMKKRVLFFLLLTCCIGYTICMGWVAPWIAWRYVSNIYPIFLIVLGVFLACLCCHKTVRYLALLACIWIGLGRLYTDGLSMVILNHGIAEYMVQEVREYIGEEDIVYMQTSTDVHSLFYYALMWPSGAKVYATSPEAFKTNRKKAEKILCNNTVKVWVDTENRWEEEVLHLMKQCGYRTFDCVYVYEGGNTVEQFAIYQCSKTEDVD